MKIHRNLPKSQSLQNLPKCLLSNALISIFLLETTKKLKIFFIFFLPLQNLLRSKITRFRLLQHGRRPRLVEEKVGTWEIGRLTNLWREKGHFSSR